MVNVVRYLEDNGYNVGDAVLLGRKLSSRSKFADSDFIRWLKSKRGRNRVLREAETLSLDVLVTSIRFSPCVHLASTNAEISADDYPGVIFIDVDLARLGSQ